MLQKALTFVFAVAGSFANPTCPLCRRTPQSLGDLGYAKRMPTSINTTASGHKAAVYKNIRFANNPVGSHRFRKADTTLPILEAIQDSDFPPRSLDRISSGIGLVPFPDINGTTWGNEDRLDLDVYVPEGVEYGVDVPVLLCRECVYSWHRVPLFQPGWDSSQHGWEV